MRLGTLLRSQVITKETTRSSMLWSGRNGLEGNNNARGPFDKLSCSSHYKNSILCISLCGPKLSHANTLRDLKKVLDTTPWPSDVHRTSSRLRPLITVDYTYLVLLSKCSFGNALTVRFCAWQEVYSEQHQLVCAALLNLPEPLSVPLRVQHCCKPQGHDSTTPSFNPW